jgi:hypothetical protein
MPAANENVIVQDTGILGSAWVAMIAYYFGGSSGTIERRDCGESDRRPPVTE